MISTLKYFGIFEIWIVRLNLIVVVLFKIYL
jgi:hypothetical protein